MAEPFFRMLEIVVPPLVAVNGTTITYDGLDNIPQRGGALIAVNHTGYLDWLPVSLAALRRRRRLRFMIKAEMQKLRSVGFVIRRIKLIPVNRWGVSDSYAVAVERLGDGELVGLHPEGTISRSFELTEFKSGAARMALAAGVPIIPCIVWGAQRIWTKDHPKTLWRNKIPVIAKFGEPVSAAGNAGQTTARLHEAMTSMLHRAQQEYPHPAGAYWVPHRLGGGAPTLAEADAMWEAEVARRALRRAEQAAAEATDDRRRRRRATPR
jgi:1-acyl-sn-glycerol-3-phosphate acyltransferase